MQEATLSHVLPRTASTRIQRCFSQLMELQSRVTHFVQAEHAANAQFLAEMALTDFIRKLEEDITRLLKFCQQVTGDFEANPAFCAQWKFFLASMQEEIRRIEAFEVNQEKRLLAAKARTINFFKQRLIVLCQDGVVEEQDNMESRVKFSQKAENTRTSSLQSSGSSFDSNQSIQKTALLAEFFKGILKDLAELNLNLKSPRIFLTYAPEGKAEAEIATTFIKWLHKKLKLNLYSDQSLLGNGSDPFRGQGESDNLWSKLCLLPNQDKLIDYAVLRGSKLLGEYIEADIYLDYYAVINRALSSMGGERWQTFDNRYDTLSPIIKQFSKKPGFHSVLTELAFLQYRKTQSKITADTFIIPIVLDEEAEASLPDFVPGPSIKVEKGLEVAFLQLLIWLFAKERV